MTIVVNYFDARGNQKQKEIKAVTETTLIKRIVSYLETYDHHKFLGVDFNEDNVSNELKQILKKL